VNNLGIIKTVSAATLRNYSHPPESVIHIVGIRINFRKREEMNEPVPNKVGILVCSAATHKLFQSKPYSKCSGIDYGATPVKGVIRNQRPNTSGLADGALLNITVIAARQESTRKRAEAYFGMSLSVVTRVRSSTLA